MNKSIKFPEKEYIAFHLEHNDTLTAFMTPYGEDSAAKKRIETVDAWYQNGKRKFDHETKSYYETDVNPPMIFDNIPMYGFIIESRLNRGGSYYGNQDKWKIDDPRGFQLEISGGNLLKIIQACTIKNGLIEDDLIWAEREIKMSWFQ